MNYNVLFNINYKNNEYVILSNNFNKFYLKVVDSKYYYPTIDEFIELDNIFNIDINNYIYTNSFKNFIPKVFYNGVLTILTTSLLMTGCSNYKIDEYNVDDLITEYRSNI